MGQNSAKMPLRGNTVLVLVSNRTSKVWLSDKSMISSLDSPHIRIKVLLLSQTDTESVHSGSVEETRSLKEMSKNLNCILWPGSALNDQVHVLPPW